mmetsp:Transcript_22105/g.33757  ORF Transcript_22105/g.33757 Transcript_22105/m.33757 type:complete len:263 (+) Transcript_22105:2205-2993(+)
MGSTAFSTLGPGINDNIVGNRIGLGTAIALQIQSMHALQQLLRPLSGKLLLALSPGMNHRIKRVFIGFHVHIPLNIQFIHPLQNLFRTLGRVGFTRPRPRVDNRIENSSRGFQMSIQTSELIQLIHMLQNTLRTFRRTLAPTLGPRVDRHGVHLGSGLNARIVRLLFLADAVQPMLHHRRALAAFGLGPCVHNGVDGQNGRIERPQGRLCQFAVHAEEPLAFVVRIRMIHDATTTLLRVHAWHQLREDGACITTRCSRRHTG